MSETSGYVVGGTAPRNSQAARRIAVLLGLVIAFGWTYLLAGRSRSVANMHQDAVTMAAEWTVAGLLVVIAFLVVRRTLAFYRFRWFGVVDLVVMLSAFVATFLLVSVVSRFVSMPTSSLDIQQLGRVPFLFRLGLVATAAVCEEFMYRGFGIEELNRLTGSWWFAGALSWAGFTFAHIDRYGWTPALLIPAIAGGMLTLVYLWRRNLPVCMLMHFMIDGVSILVVPFFLHAH